MQTMVPLILWCSAVLLATLASYSQQDAVSVLRSVAWAATPSGKSAASVPGTTTTAPRHAEDPPSGKFVAAEAAVAAVVPLLKPIWLHIPKTGSSFTTTLAHYVCGNLPPDFDVMHNFEKRIGKCMGSFGRIAGHEPLRQQDINKFGLDSVVTLLRDPRKRVLSGYLHSFHSCPHMQARYHCSQKTCGQPLGCKCPDDIKVGGVWVRDPAVHDILEYAKCVGNCSAHMLTGRDCAAADNADVETAVSRIEKFGFVGITDEWQLTICLFHSKFGGKVLAQEQNNLRPGMQAAAKGPQAAALAAHTEHMLGLLQGWQATGELRVYDAALARFNRELRQFGISRSSCKRFLANGTGEDLGYGHH